MSSQLRTELKQNKPFEGLEHEAVLSVERTAAVLMHSFAEALKTHGITPTQFNVLRILRGAGPDGLSRNDIRERLVAQVPDVTRLVDRLMDAGLVERERNGQDRRVVTTRITSAGLALLARLDEPVAEMHRHEIGHLSAEQLRTLIDLLALVRSGA